MFKCAPHPQSYKWEGNLKVTKVRELLSPSPVTYLIMKCSPNCSNFIKMHHSAQDLSTQHMLARNLSHLRQMFVRRFCIWIKVTDYSWTGHSGQNKQNSFFDSTWDLISCKSKQNMLFVSLQRPVLPADTSDHWQNRVQWQRHTNLPISRAPSTGQHPLSGHSTGKKRDDPE